MDFWLDSFSDLRASDFLSDEELNYLLTCSRDSDDPFLPEVLYVY